jgi:glycerate kinase
MAFLNAELQPGIATVLDYTNFDQYLSDIDLMITGEGKLDHQTLHGKLIHGICQKAAQFNVPVIALCGTLAAKPDQINSIGLRAAFSIMDKPRRLAEAISDTACLLEATSFNLIRSWSHD